MDIDLPRKRFLRPVRELRFEKVGQSVCLSGESEHLKGAKSPDTGRLRPKRMDPIYQSEDRKIPLSAAQSEHTGVAAVGLNIEIFVQMKLVADVGKSVIRGVAGVVDGLGRRALPFSVHLLQLLNNVSHAAW